LIEKSAEVLWVGGAPLSREISAGGASAPFGIAAFQLAVASSGLLPVVSDCLIARLNLLHAAVYYEARMGATAMVDINTRFRFLSNPKRMPWV
jgi:hypothetical protein